MRYIDAGYVIALVILLGYGASLVARRRRLDRSVIAPDSDGIGYRSVAGEGADRGTGSP